MLTIGKAPVSHETCSINTARVTRFSTRGMPRRL